jgi:MOSC domain-containing protein YiiM
MSAQIEWIGVRPERRASVISVNSVVVDEQDGLTGDHPVMSHRQVTMISKEGLDAAAVQLGRSSIDPALTRRNIVISGLDFNQAPGTRLYLGEVIVEVTGECHPCERMEENLGSGGRAALASRGGLTAKVIKGGPIGVGDPVHI